MTAPMRIVISDVAPQVAGGRFPLKRVVGEPVCVKATVFCDGHDELYVALNHEVPHSDSPVRLSMTCTNPGLDVWEVEFTPQLEGLYRFRVMAWIDRFSSWFHGVLRKSEAGQDISMDCPVGVQFIEGALKFAFGSEQSRLVLALDALQSGELMGIEPVVPLMSALVARHEELGGLPVSSGAIEVLVERERALFGAWYEVFPRSLGNLRDVANKVDYVADMGFDVLYLPPIHPIGATNRKGPDNTVSKDSSDPGSPWAIGGVGGGHMAIHPDLGTFADFDHLVSVLEDRKMEIALDLALQCSPDHPWVHDHPDWFRHRPDGSIQYAENPPKRYEDIFPLDFECRTWRALWDEILFVVRFWIARGVRIFRVDNPHTKPFAFWEWLLREVREDHPDVVWLAEAFTRPTVMHRLAQLGFSQSYTYFTWRVAKWDLREYFTELSTPPSVDEFRPNVWPNTPDILPWHLQDSPPEMNALRFVLAATLSASYGIYGPAFELAANHPADNGKEEYGSSEKYELKNWDLDTPNTIRPLIARVNQIRHTQDALRTNRTLRFHEVGNDGLLCFSKTTHAGPNPDPERPRCNPMFMAVNLDPVNINSEIVQLDLGSLGIDPSRPFEAYDMLNDRRYTWHGSQVFIELDPTVTPAHIMRISQPSRS